LAGNKLLKVGEASKFLGISRDALRRLEDTGELPPTHKEANGTRLYSLQSLMLYRDAQAQGTSVSLSETQRRLKNTVIFLSMKYGFTSYTEILDNCQRFLHRPPDERYAELPEDSITRQDIDIFCELFSLMPPGRES